MLAEEESLVRGVDHNGVFRGAVLVEPVKQAADVLVDRNDSAQVAIDVALVIEVIELLPAGESEALARVSVEQHAVDRSIRLGQLGAFWPAHTVDPGVHQRHRGGQAQYSGASI